MKIIVRLFAGLKCTNENTACYGQNEFETEISSGMNLEKLLEYLGIARDLAKIVFVNGLFKPLTYQLEDGDEVSIFPPVGGG